MKPSNSTSLQQKQTYLRSQIIDAGVDPDTFMVYMGAAKGQGDNINLQNWTFPQLKKVVSQFKESLQQQLKRQKQLHQSKLTSAQALARNRSSMQVADRVMGGGVIKKQKVFYDKDDLWDFQYKTKQQCKKTHQFFNFSTLPQINYKGVQIKKTGGFFFGIGAKYYIQLILSSNFSSATVARKSQDVDWLRSVLVAQFPGSYIPPLQQTPIFQGQDKAIALKRAKQIVSFLNSLIHFDYLVNNKFTHMFLTQNDRKAFQNFKTKNMTISTVSDIKAIQNLQGSFPIQISQRIMQFVKNSGKFSKQAAQLYKNIQVNLIKIHNDFDSLAKHSHYLAADLAKFRQKCVAISQKSNFSQSLYANQNNLKISAVFGQLKHVFSTLQSHSKKQSIMIKDITQENIKYCIKQWSQFDILQKKYKRQLDSYLTLKSVLSKKKQQFFLDTSKKQLQQRQKTGISKQTTLAQKQQLYKQIYSRDYKLQEDRRKWQGYVNQIYQRSFMTLLAEQEKQIEKKLTRIYNVLPKMLNQRIAIYTGFDNYIQEDLKKGQNQIMVEKKAN